jgi:hypothetical protein
MGSSPLDLLPSQMSLHIQGLLGQAVSVPVETLSPTQGRRRSRYIRQFWFIRSSSRLYVRQPSLRHYDIRRRNLRQSRPYARHIRVLLEPHGGSLSHSSDRRNAPSGRSPAIRLRPRRIRSVQLAQEAEEHRRYRSLIKTPDWNSERPPREAVFLFVPRRLCCGALPVEIILHFGEFLYDGLDPVPEFGAGQVPID